MKNYLVIQLARFGDLIQTKRLLKTLCNRENASVHLCVDRSLEALARLVYPQVTVHAIAAHGTGLKGNEAIQAMLVDNTNVFCELKSFDFKTIYNLNFSPLNFRLAALFDSDRIEGYAWKDGQEITTLWPSMAMRWSDYRRLGINLVDFWAGYCPDMIAPASVNPEASPKGGGIGVVLAGRESRRSLPVATLTRTVTTLASSSETNRIQLLGGASEVTAGQAVIKELPPKLQAITSNLAGKTSWADLIDVVGSLDMLITPDTGTMHLAAHLGTPVRAFFLSSAWCFETGPYGRGHTVYQASTECLPCLETQECPYETKCLSAFNAPEFQRFLVTNKMAHAPDGMIAFHSEFDALGQTYTSYAGVDKQAEQRIAFRTFIQQYLTGSGGNVSDFTQILAERIYRDRDWITQLNPNATLGI
jgi:ADP-heptose:LPS heptosyltransferase